MEDTLVAPIRVGVRNMSEAVKAVPDSVLNTVDEVVDLYRRIKKPIQPRLPPSTPDFGHRGSIDIEVLI